MGEKKERTKNQKLQIGESWKLKPIFQKQIEEREEWVKLIKYL